MASSAWNYCSNFDVAAINGADTETENYFSSLGSAAFAAWNARGLTSVSQTAAANQSCSSYSSDIPNPGIFVFSPVR